MVIYSFRLNWYINRSLLTVLQSCYVEAVIPYCHSAVLKSIIFQFSAGYYRELETVLNVMIMNEEREDLVMSISNEYVEVFYFRSVNNSRTPLTKVTPHSEF